MFFVRMLRRIYRIPFLIVWVVVQGLISVPIRYFYTREKCIPRMTRQTRAWGKGLLWIFGIRLDVHGDLSVAHREGGLVVSNHLGYLDIFLHGALFGPRFTPKLEIKSWPVLGWYVGLTRPVWICRHASVEHFNVMIREFRESFELKVPLVVYPEGTSTSGFDGVKEFKNAPFMPVCGTSFPIHPVLTFWEFKAGDLNPAWYGDMTLLPHVWRLLGNGPMTAHVYLLPVERADGRDRRQLAADLHQAMSNRYTEVSAELRGTGRV